MAPRGNLRDDRQEVVKAAAHYRVRLMNFDGNVILASLLMSSIGVVLLTYGRKMSRAPQLIAGVILLVYPYFVGSVVTVLGIGAGVLLLMWLAIVRGF
jgi:hypothetical protein